MTKCGLSQASQHSKIDQCNLPYEKTREEKVHGLINKCRKITWHVSTSICANNSQQTGNTRKIP